MNSFLEHHRDSIRFDYSCFDRMILAGHIQGLQVPGQVVWYLRNQRHAESLSRQYFARISRDYGAEVETLARDQGLDVLKPERKQRREKLVAPYFENLQQPGLAVILKAREPERIAVNLYGEHLEMAQRWVTCYTFYLRDAQLGQMSVRICSYFPFNISVWLNGHEYLACQMRHQGIAFRQCDNSFLDCAAPDRLQKLADEFGAEQIQAALDPWLAQLLPYFGADERAQGYRHHLVQRQVEYCHNIIFHERAALTRLFNRMLDHCRTLGRPDKLAVIFNRSRFRINAHTGEVQLKVTPLRTPVLRAGLEKTDIKQYVRDGALLRTEAASFQLKELGLPKGLVHLPKVREVLSQCNERFESVQQDILETYVDRGQLEALRQTTVSPSGRRTPGLRPHDPRLLALLRAVISFMHLVGKGGFKTAALLADVQMALGNPAFTLSQLRYDLGKLRGKGLVQRLKGSQRYELTATGYRLSVLYLKLYDRYYAPLTAGLLDPVPADTSMPNRRLAKLDRLYKAVDLALHNLDDHIGLTA